MEVVQHTLDYSMLESIFRATPGLVADKLKRVLEVVWHHLKGMGKRGIIFAYDEAQNLRPFIRQAISLSLLLDVFQSIQKKEIPFMLALTGLPTLFPKLVEARTFAERMFHVIHIDRLNDADSRKAIPNQLKKDSCPFHFLSYQWQYCPRIRRLSLFHPVSCRETYDIFIQRIRRRGGDTVGDLRGVVRKLDADFSRAGGPRQPIASHLLKR